MAKCVKKGTTVKRVSNEEAKVLVDVEGWSYCAKNKWIRYV